MALILSTLSTSSIKQVPHPFGVQRNQVQYLFEVQINRVPQLRTPKKSKPVGAPDASNTEGVTLLFEPERSSSERSLNGAPDVNSAFVLLSELCSDELLTPKVLQIQVQVKSQTRTKFGQKQKG